MRTAFLCASAIVTACGSSGPSTKADLARLCDAPSFAEVNPAARGAAISAWVDANVKAPAARAIFAALGTLPKFEHAAHLRKAAAAQGLPGCALADRLERDLAPTPTPTAAPTPAPSAEPTPGPTTTAAGTWKVEITGAKATADRTLTHEHLMYKVMSAYQAGLRRCGKQLATGATELTITFTIEEHGRATAASVRASNRDLADCVRQQVGNWRFPSPTDNHEAPATVEAELTVALTPPP